MFKSGDLKIHGTGCECFLFLFWPAFLTHKDLFPFLKTFSAWLMQMFRSSRLHKECALCINCVNKTKCQSDH